MSETKLAAVLKTINTMFLLKLFCFTTKLRKHFKPFLKKFRLTNGAKESHALPPSSQNSLVVPTTYVFYCHKLHLIITPKLLSGRARWAAGWWWSNIRAKVVKTVFLLLNEDCAGSGQLTSGYFKVS